MGSSDTKSKEEIASLRERIDVIDDEIIALLLQRIELSNLIMKSKAPSQIVDSGREQAILKRYSEKLGDASTLPKSKRLVLGIIGASRMYPEA